MTNYQKHTQLFQHIFEASSQAIFVITEEKIILKANLAAQIASGYTEKELANKFIDTVIPELSKKIETDSNEHLSELWLKKKDGSQSLINIQLNTIANNEGFDTVLFIEDVTDNLIYKWALKGSQKSLSNIESEGNLGNWYWIFKTNERYWSDEFYRICGLSPDDDRLNAETAISFIHPDDRKMAIEVVNQAIENNRPYHFEKRIVHPNGIIRNVIARGNVDYDSTGAPIGMSGTMRDITALKNKQKELLDSNRKHQTLIDNLNGIVYSCQNNQEYTMDYINDGCYAITGYTSDEFLNGSVHFGTIILNEDRVYVWNQIQEALSQKKHYDIQYRIVCKKGTIKYVREIGCGVHNGQYTLEGFITDITQQKNMQDILEFITEDTTLSLIGNKIIKTIESQIPECAAIISIKNLTTNKFERLSESNAIETFSTSIDETKHPDLKLLHPAFNSSKAILITNILNHKNWINQRDQIVASGLKSCWSFPILSLKKNHLGFLSIYYTDEKQISKKDKEIITDVVKLLKVAIEKNHTKTKLKEKEELLKAYAQKLEAKVEKRTEEVAATVEQLVATNLSLEDQKLETEAAEKIALASKSLLSTIAKNFPNGFIIVFNANFEILLGEGQAIYVLGLHKVIFEGMSIDDLSIFSEKQKTKLKEDIVKTMQGDHLSLEMQYRKKYFSVNTTPLVDKNNNVASALFVYNDISQQKTIERDAQNALKKEQELNELKSRFISMASHEFRTPLSAIQTSAILIGKQNEPGKEEKRTKYVRQIKNNVKHLVVILNDFLSLSKLEEGKITAHRENFDLVSLAKTVVEEISTTTKTNQSIIFSSSEDTLSFNLDPKLIRHILMNLLSNAIKYSPENSTIHFNIEEEDLFVVIKISDEGIGIPKEEQKNLFERFFRAKNAYNIEGTGLGLNIVKQYVELMDGSIDFTSEENNGTTFQIKLPKPT
ncbi:PAS domain-containing protein [Kordia sp. YSTF-M3]|uniref:histidine kinase n=1 Tax=Kordia aestuariivivens TaxID=2759037 RepID=A0ABR7QGI0_9FLAO|nr:PAS domain-containing protein [Kordia aestuariivivens]MBC8757644.1 PAS domain-containing protein [Kordia aestuariivivens]